MNIWLITDTHFGHEGLMCPEAGRPKDYAARIRRSLGRIPADAVLIHLGDVCIGDDAEHHYNHIAPLACKKWLVRGNHDKKSVGWYLEHGWDFVADAIVLNAFGEWIMFSHEPLAYEGLNICGHLHLHRPEPNGDKTRRIVLRLETDGYQARPLRAVLKGAA